MTPPDPDANHLASGSSLFRRCHRTGADSPRTSLRWRFRHRRLRPMRELSTETRERPVGAAVAIRHPGEPMTITRRPNSSIPPSPTLVVLLTLCFVTLAPMASARADAGAHDACGPDAGHISSNDPSYRGALPDPITVPIDRVRAVCTAGVRSSRGQWVGWLGVLGAITGLGARRRGRARAQRSTV